MFRRVRLLPILLLTLLVTSLASCASAVTVGQHVVVLREPAGFHSRQRMEIHEAIHKRQYRERGTLPMVLTYLLSPSRRLKLEAEAYAAELCYLMRVGDRRHQAWREGFSIALRGYSVLGAVSHHHAQAQLAHAYRDGAACDRLLIEAGRSSVLAAYPSP
ncbi:MAG: hypothetical protein M3418_04060 [Gemmatimonadota bacterium]|nr:hypothetical protein [Gemmatimonadota bacterium]